MKIYWTISTSQSFTSYFQMSQDRFYELLRLINIPQNYNGFWHVISPENFANVT